MSIPPLFPTLSPRLIDSLWFNVDKPCEDENEINQLEQEHASWLNGISQENSELPPIGKGESEQIEEEEEEDDEEDDNDDDSESHDEEDDEEMDVEVSYDRDSPVDVSIQLGSGLGVR